MTVGVLVTVSGGVGVGPVGDGVAVMLAVAVAVCVAVGVIVGVGRVEVDVGVLVIVAVLAGVLLRVGLGCSKKRMERDEMVSLLAATGHQGEYARVVRQGEDPVGRWVTAGQWKRFCRPAEPWCFGRIASDLRLTPTL